MLKFHRLVGGELYKIVMRPIIYIITAVLAVVLFFSCVTFDPVNRIDTSYYAQIDGNNKNTIYENFRNNPTLNKNISDAKMNSAYATLDSIAKQESIVDSIGLLLSNNTGTNGIIGTQYLFNSGFVRAVEVEKAKRAPDFTAITSFRLQIIDNLKTVNDKLKTSVATNNLRLFVKEKDYKNFTALLSRTLSTFRADNKDLSAIETYIDIVTVATQDELFERLYEFATTTIMDVTLSEKSLEDLTFLYEYSKETQSIILENAIVDKEDESISSAEYKRNLSDYFYISDMFLELVNDSIKFESIKGMNDTYAQKYAGYQDVCVYQLKERITKNTYLLKKDLTPNTASTPFNLAISSGQTANAYDLMFYGLQGCSMVIILLAMLTIAGQIAGETQNGTLKVLLTRPFKRHKVLSAKILSTLIISVALLILCALILFITGWIVYGLDATPIVAIFNASSAFRISPFMLMFVYLLFLIVKIFFYTIMTAAFANIFKNNIATTIVSMVIFFFVFITPLILANSFICAYLPFAGIDLFNYFGGAYIGKGVVNFAAIFSTPMYPNSTFVVSIITSMITLAAAIFISYIIFNKREFK